MNTISWADRPAKSKCRKKVIKAHGRVCKAMLMMPSTKFLDVGLAFKMGLANKHTDIYCVEKDPANLIAMRRFLRHAPFPTERIHIIPQELHKVKIPQKLDFAFLDLCGCLTSEISTWLATEFISNLDQRATVALTISSHRNPSPWLPIMNQWFEDHKHFPTVSHGKLIDQAFERYFHQLDTTSPSLVAARTSFNVFNVILRSQFLAKMRRVIPYRDTSNMVTVIYNLTEKRQNQSWVGSNLISHIKPHSQESKNTTMQINLIEFQNLQKQLLKVQEQQAQIQQQLALLMAGRSARPCKTTAFQKRSPLSKVIHYLHVRMAYHKSVQNVERACTIQKHIDIIQSLCQTRFPEKQMKEVLAHVCGVSDKVLKRCFC